MNTQAPISLVPVEPLLDRLNAVESRLLAVEMENRQLRRTRSTDPRHVSREDARKQLGNIGNTLLHQLIRKGDLDTIKISRRTLVTQSSIDRYLASCAKT